MTFIDGAVVLTLLALFIQAGSVFASLIFVQDISSFRERHIFSISFGAAGVSFCAIFLDAFGVLALTREFSVGVVRLSLGILLIVSWIIVPALLWNQTLRGVRIFCKARGIRYLLSVLLAVCCVIIVFRALPSLPPLAADEQVPSWIDYGVTKLAYFGVTVVAVLTGFAAVTTPASFLAPYLYRHRVDELKQSVTVMSQRQKVLANLWLAKRRSIAERWLKKNAAAAQQNGTRGSEGGDHSSFFRRITSFFVSSRDDGIEALDEECSGLEKMCMNNFLSLSEACEVLRVAQSGRSMSSMVSAVFGVILSVFAAIKVIQVTLGIVMSCSQRISPSTTGPATQMSSGGSGDGSIPLDDPAAVVEPASWLVELVIGSAAMRRIAAFFNAFMMITAIRGFLLIVFRLASRYVTFPSAAVTVLVFSFAMCAFFVAQLLMLRERVSDDELSVARVALGGIADAAHRKLNNACFAASFIATMLVRKFLLPSTSDEV